MITHTLDARALNPGDVFFHFCTMNAPKNPRRVVRMWYRIGVLEILHGLPDQPGKLEYTLFACGAQVVVPVAWPST